ncbi:MAG: putative DNA binding domain-containing protein [Bacteroidales bacterium]|nr:putative DNA binding domain-containing protein [Bacteroidales bacterium]
MDGLELAKIIALGETSRVQFKELLDSEPAIAAEMIAMSNAKGGIIVFGVRDKTGEITGLDYSQLQKIGNRIATLATDAIKPQIFVTTEAISIHTEVGERNVLVVHIAEGFAKPYKDNNGTIWVKQGCDKRKLTDNNELFRLFQQNGNVYVDEIIVPYTSIADIDKEKVSAYLAKIGDEETVQTETLYQNLNILRNDSLTLGGLLFFGKNPQRYRPAFCIKAVSFFGNDLAGTAYRDSEDIEGTIPKMFQKAMSFFTRNLHHIQAGQSFNSVGILEISPIALEELLQNALTHRDFSKNSPIRIFIFDNRVEIISPGALPNSQTVEAIKMGNAVVRNNLINTFASKLMKYRGTGTGIRRSIKEQPNVEFFNDVSGEQFVVTIPRVQQ